MIDRALVGVLTLTIAVAPTRAQTPPPGTGEQLVQAMHDRYDGKWFKTMTFVQTTTRWDSTGKQTVKTWYESAAVPSKLRIDFGSPKEGNGALFTADSTYDIRKGQIVHTDSGGNDLTTLLFDVYLNPVDRTVASLTASGYDLSRIHQTTWQGRRTWVVGAPAHDRKMPQFWVDAERLVVVRQIGPIHAGDPRLLDARFNKYRPIGGGWIAVENYFLVDGKPGQREEYADVKADVPLDPSLFDPHQWMTAKHWVQ